MLTHSAIVTAIADGATIALAYRKPNGVLTVRSFEPYSIARCKNGNTIVQGHCPHDGHPKSLTLTSILAVGATEAQVRRALA